MTADEQGIIRKKGPPGRKFIACDLDNTLAEYDRRIHGQDRIGAPIPPVLAMVKAAIARGDVVCIWTSRVVERDTPARVYAAIHHWCEEHIGERLYVTALKHRYFHEFWDTKCMRIDVKPPVLA